MMRSVFVISATLVLAACDPVAKEEIKEAADIVAGQVNNQELDRLCIASDDLIADLNLFFNSMTDEQLTDYSRYSRENRVSCNERQGLMITLHANVKNNNDQMQALLETFQ